MNRLVYEREPDIEFDDIDIDDDDDEEEEGENPYDGYSTYDVEIVETAIKHVRVFAPNWKTAKDYITDFVGLDEIKMDDIDKYVKKRQVLWKKLRERNPITPYRSGLIWRRRNETGKPG